MDQRHPKTVELTRAGLDVIQQAISIYDDQLTLVVSNRQFQDMFDLPDWVVRPGASFEATIHALVENGEYGTVTDREEFVRGRVKTARAFEAHYFERVRPNGRWVSIEGAPLPQGGWVSVYTDITEIRNQESLLLSKAEDFSGDMVEKAKELTRTNRSLRASNAALRAAQESLREMEARTRLVNEMSPAHIARIDRSGIYTYSNRRLSQILKGRPSEIIGLHMEEALGPEAWSQVAPAVERAFLGRDEIVEFTYAPQNRWVRAAFTPDIEDNGVTGLHILSIDVTEEVQARAVLNQTRKRELAAQLTSGLAHDFSNLLTIILGLQSQLERAKLDRKSSEAVAGTLAAARRGVQLLDRISNLASPPAQQVCTVYLPKLLNDLKALAEPSLPEQISLEIKVVQCETPVLLDPGGFNDQMINLILNAADSIGDRLGRITITCRSVDDAWIVLTVDDSGTGFTDEALQYGFDPFFTTKGGDGSGLGLSMVYDQAKLMGGHVRMENLETVGARVELQLPMRAAPPGGQPILVLVVEDNETVREEVRELLISLGHQVVESSGAEEARKMANIDGLGLILSDLNLHDGSGLDLLRSLRDTGITVPALFMTARAPGDGLRMSAERLAPVLSKPILREDLAGALSDLRGAAA